MKKTIAAILVAVGLGFLWQALGAPQRGESPPVTEHVAYIIKTVSETPLSRPAARTGRCGSATSNIIRVLGIALLIEPAIPPGKRT